MTKWTYKELYTLNIYSLTLPGKKLYQKYFVSWHQLPVSNFLCQYRKQNPFYGIQIKLNNWWFLILQFFKELSRKKASVNTSLFYFLRTPGKLRGSENKNVWAKALLWPSPSASEQNTRKSSSGDDSWFWGGKGVLCWFSVSTSTALLCILQGHNWGNMYTIKQFTSSSNINNAGL